jgi:hypothetical protein
MKYLKYREDFLHKEVKLDESKIKKQIKDSVMISEAFENDITWGGSLLGRMINSIIRKGKVMVNSTRIESLTKDLKSNLDELVADALTGSDDNIKKKVELIKVRFLITAIYEVVESNKTVAEKKGELVADGADDAGLIQVTIKEIEKISDEQLPKKRELIDKLKKFREALLKLKVEAEPAKDDDDDDDNSETKFYNHTVDLLKSVVSLNDVILNKKIKPQQKQQLEVGKEYTNKNNKVCMIVSLEYAITRPNKDVGGDGVFFTKDDKKGETLAPGMALVVYRDEKTKKYLSNSPTQTANKNELKPYDGKDTVKDEEGKPLQQTTQNKPNTTVTKPKPDAQSSSQDEKDKVEKNESFVYYENESLPIFEDTEVMDNELHAKAAWNKVLNTWNKTGISKMVPRIQELLKNSESGTNADLYKKTIIKIGKQVIINKSTVGANPIKFEELIKEEADITSENDIPKAISLVSRVILSFKEDMGLLGALGDANSSIKLFVNSFSEMDKIYPNLKSKKEEPKKEEQKTPEAQNASRLHNYSRFLSLNEADEDQPEMEEENNEPQNKSEKSETDEVKTEWSKEFKEGEEKEWTVDEKEAKDLQKETDVLEGKETNIKVDPYVDQIIRIIRIFEKAYRLYATDVIPSGRPNGRISQKTFREYEYIGGKGENPTWTADAGPSGGPWAAKLPYQKWQDGVMKILEEPKYRKVLANIKFVSTAESSTDTAIKNPGSGRTLFTFINDLLAGEGTFRSVRKKILDDYFTTDEMKKKAGQNTETQPIIQPIDPDNEGKTNQLIFNKPEVVGLNPIQRNDFERKSGFTLVKSFMKIKYTSGGNNHEMISYINNYFKTERNKYILIKFQSVKDKQTESVITSYLKEDIDKGLKLPEGIKNDPTKETLIGIIDLNKGYFSSGVKNEFEIKFIKAVDLDTSGDNDFKSMSIKLTDVEILTKLVENKDGKQQTEMVKGTGVKVKSKNNPSEILKKIKNSGNLRKGFGIIGTITT